MPTALKAAAPAGLSTRGPLRPLMCLLTCMAAGCPAAPAAAAGANTAASPPLAQPAPHPAAWATSAQPVRAALPEAIRRALRSQDVLAYAAPGVLYPLRNIGLQCQGANASLVDVPQQRVDVLTTDGRSAQRFGEASLDGVAAFRLQAAAADALPAGTSARCELAAYPMTDSALPNGQTFWWAASFWVDDWGASRDEQSIAQFHVQEPRNILLNPFFALVVRGGTMRVELRHNPLPVPSRATTTLVTAATLPVPVRQWFNVVVQARLGNDAAQAPFLRLWLGGTQQVDYAGALGYVLPPGGMAYAKAGVYHWLAGNDWDTAVPERTVLIGSMLAVRDGGGRYAAAQIGAAVAPGPRR